MPRSRTPPTRGATPSIKKADAEYDVAKEKCDDLAGNAKDVCVKDAKAAREKAKTSAKSMKTLTPKQALQRAAGREPRSRLRPAGFVRMRARTLRSHTAPVPRRRSF